MSGLPYEVYFSFADDLFGYHCQECGFKCCKGEGFGATEQEIKKLNDLYPTLPYFTVPQTKHNPVGVDLANFKPACFFLQDSGYCDIHVKHGRDTKPIVCKTFPANRYFFSNGILVVGLNFLCPLKVSTPGCDDIKLLHEEILQDIKNAPDYVRNTGTPKAREKKEPDMKELILTKDIIVNETWCRDISKRIEKSDLWSVLAAWEWAAEHGLQHPLDKSYNAAISRLKSYRQEMIRFAGLKDHVGEENAANDGVIIAMAPSIRMHLLQQYANLSYKDEFLPLASKVFCGISVFTQLMFELQNSPVSPQAIMQLVQRFPSLFLMLGYLNHIPNIPSLKKGEKMTIRGPRASETMLKKILQFVYEQNDDMKLTLGEIVKRFSKEEGFDPIMCLKSFSPQTIRYLSFRPSTG